MSFYLRYHHRYHSIVASRFHPTYTTSIMPLLLCRLLSFLFLFVFFFFPLFIFVVFVFFFFFFLLLLILLRRRRCC